MKVKANQMALGGMMPAVAVVIMSLGSLIPVNTYVCPVLCILITRVVMERCGGRLSWCYYMAVAMLSLLLAPDREAALVYLCLGYYPLIRRHFERRPTALRTPVTLLFFTIAGVAAYGLLMLVLGVEAVMAEYEGAGMWLLAVTVLMWDVLFLLVDRLLGGKLERRK